MGASWVINQTRPHISRTWADESVVYDTVTGDTHFLEPFATELFSRLERGLQDQDQLIKQLLENFIFSPEEDVTALTESALAKLQSIGLVVTSS